MNSHTIAVLTYWQMSAAAGADMARVFYAEGDFLAAIKWQKYAAVCYRNILSNGDTEDCIAALCLS